MTRDDLSDLDFCTKLDIIYGPGWSVDLATGQVVPGPSRWPGMTEMERKVERERIMDLWRREGWTVESDVRPVETEPREEVRR